MKKLLIISIFAFLNMAIFAQDNTSLTLKDAVNRALENNYGIQTVKKSLEIDSLNNTWGAAGALPSVSFSGGGSESMNFNDNDNYTNTAFNSGVDLNWVIFRGFSARINKENLEALEVLSEGNLAITVENTIVDVILAYYDVLLAESNVEIMQKSMSLSEDRYELEKQKQEIGTSVTYDILQAKNAFLEDKSNLLSSQSSFRNAIRQLSFLMADPEGMEYDLTSEYDLDFADFQIDTLNSKMLENNNTLQNQYVNLEIAKLNVRSAKSAYYPTISAGASGTYQYSDMNYETNNLMDNTTDGFNTGVNVGISYSIYEGGSRKRILQAAKIMEEISDVETLEMKRQMTNQLSQEYELYLLRKDLLVLANDNLEAAELNLELSKERYKNGTINSFNYRDVQQLYANIALNHENAMYNLVQSYYTLLRLTGGVIDEF
jgi:outer membrane protein TolC